MSSSKAALNTDNMVNALKLNPGHPNNCEQHSRCPECEYLLQCAEGDSAWTGEALEEVRTLAFTSAFIQIRSCDETKEELFLRTFKTRMTAELGLCTSADMNWAKNAFKVRKEKIEELERRFEEELDNIIFEDSDMILMHKYAKKLDQYYGPLMTDEEYLEALRKAEKRFIDNINESNHFRNCHL